MFRLLNKYDSCKSDIVKQISLMKCCFICIRKKSFYHVLGLNSTASVKEIKSAYYKLSLEFHPDKNIGKPESVDKFREITEAYEVLSNPEKKKIYDQRGGFQSEYSRNSTYSESYYRPKSYRGPFTGKTQDFDYDEHFRKHYQEYEEKRNAEHDYFKRRWEAEFYRRNPTAKDYYRNRRTENTTNEELSRRFSRRSPPLLFLIAVWSFIFIVSIYNQYLDPDIPSPKRKVPIYYGVNKENGKVGND